MGIFSPLLLGRKHNNFSAAVVSPQMGLNGRRGSLFLSPYTFICCLNLGFLNLGPIDTLGCMILCCERAALILECLAASLASAHWMLVAPPAPVVTAETVSRNCHMSPWGGVKLSLAEKH